MIQVSDTGSFEPFVVIVKIEARLGVGSTALSESQLRF
jgi:hypothetical protein